MNGIRRTIPLMAGLLLLMLQQGLYAGSGLKPFEATYNLNKGSLLIGQVEISLHISGQGDYRYSAVTRPVGLVKLFRSDEITEVSEGRILSDIITPSHYLYHHKKPDKSRKVNLAFNWKTRRVSNHVEGSKWSMDVPAGTQDKFSQQLALMLAVATGVENPEFLVADGGYLKRYSFTHQGEEEIQVTPGKYRALKLARKKEDRPSRSTLWLAPELNHLPIQIERSDKKGRFTMKLEQLQWGAPDRQKSASAL